MRNDPVQRNVALYRVAVAVVLFSIVSAPALLATPRPDDAPRLVAVSDPVAWFGPWLDSLATDLESVWQKAGCRLDPDGATCTEGATAPETSVPEAEPLNGPQNTDAHGR